MKPEQIAELFDSIVYGALEAEYDWIGYDSQVRQEEHGSTSIVRNPINTFMIRVKLDGWEVLSDYWMHPLIGLTLGNKSPYTFKEWYFENSAY